MMENLSNTASAVEHQGSDIWCQIPRRTAPSFGGNVAMAHAFSHVGLSVPDIEKAVEWYSSVLGFSVIMGPAQNDGDDTHIGQLN
ncbi:MAG: VOC family protein, partial [Spirochaetales bacterium]|nr:VOC family protein [Spirochaetales bacterium]